MSTKEGVILLKIHTRPQKNLKLGLLCCCCPSRVKTVVSRKKKLTLPCHKKFIPSRHIWLKHRISFLQFQKGSNKLLHKTNMIISSASPNIYLIVSCSFKQKFSKNFPNELSNFHESSNINNSFPKFLSNDHILTIKQSFCAKDKQTR